jgi:hypothetical protein
MESLHLINNLPLPKIIITQLLSLYNIRYRKIFEKHKKYFSKNLNKEGELELVQLNKDINDILDFYNESEKIIDEPVVNTNEINVENDTSYCKGNDTSYYRGNNTSYSRGGNNNSDEWQQVMKIRSENSKYMNSHPSKFTEYQKRFPSGTQLLNHSCGLYKTMTLNKSQSNNSRNNSRNSSRNTSSNGSRRR